jgi:hypothetical protein
MRKQLLLTLFIFTLLPFTACSGNSIQTRLGTEFSLAVGQSATITSEKMAIKFVEVTGDSRCPSGAQCIWAGEAKCTVLFSVNENEQTVTLIQSGSNSSTTTDIDGYSISFTLNPYPKVNQQIENQDYRLVLTVSKS